MAETKWKQTLPFGYGGGEEATAEIARLERQVEEQAKVIEGLRAKAELADEMLSELKSRERLSSVDALMFPRLTDYEVDLLARYDTLKENSHES